MAYLVTFLLFVILLSFICSFRLLKELRIWKEGCYYHNDEHAKYLQETYSLRAIVKDCPRCKRKVHPGPMKFQGTTGV